MKLRLNGWPVRTAALALACSPLFVLAPGCGSDSNSGGGGVAGTGAKAGADGGGKGGIGGVGNTGGGGVGNTGGGGTGATGGGGTGGCPSGQEDCGGTCTNTSYDPANCGTCGNACATGEFCSLGTCGTQCQGSKLCTDGCKDINIDEANCGDCGKACAAGEVCSVGVCGVNCIAPSIKCGTDCVNPQADAKNCGGCGVACPGTQVCSSGQCVTSCPTGLTNCSGACVDLKNDKLNCNACGAACPTGQACLNGACGACDVTTQDCDGDGWAGKNEGDCCEVPGNCGAEPKKVNPGAIEVVGNGIDDNCNGKTDLFDTADTIDCDTGLTSNSTNAKDYAKAMGICRETTETPAAKKDKTWGLIEAEILRADGTALGFADAKSIRTQFGTKVTPVDGKSLVVLSSGKAADATQTNPGPNGGAPATSNVSNTHSPTSMVDISTCTNAKCIKDWFSTANPPLKAANAFPEAPNCGGGSGETEANDSVMIRLRLRAPTNAEAFSFNSYFLSAEYPEYVCTTFNDQFVALVDTPGGPTVPIPNPVDKNLLTYLDTTNNSKWPIGINVAAGTPLFAVCEPTQTTGTCLSGAGPIGSGSCSLGAGDLAGTGFEKPTSGTCFVGGGTYWLTTAGNVRPGEIVELRITIFDVGDTAYDSTALLDGFKWLSSASKPGTG